MGLRGLGHVAVLVVIVLLTTVSTPTASAQYARAEAWNTIVEHEDVAFRFLFYSTADSHNNGIVLLLHNQNDHPVDYRFRMVFRTAEGNEQIEHVEGRLDAGEIRTGDQDGLFFIPFKDGRSIAEVGMRGYEVVQASRVEDISAVPQPSHTAFVDQT